MLSRKVAPVICEDTKNVFVACDNSILVYSLNTGLFVTTLR